MAWTMKGTWYETCSCKMACRCNFGPAEPDQGWCSAILGFAIDSGESNGVDLGGTKVILHGELPGDFVGGIDKMLLYLDEATSPEQRNELEAIFQGKRGGVWEGVAGMIAEFLPSKTVPVEVVGGESPRVKAGDFASFSMERLKTEEGKQAVLVNAPISAGFAVDTQELATATGSASDSDLRSWETLGYGAAVPFNWSF
jgi:hypothetical protein